LSLKEAIVWLGELGLSMVQIELDCKLVVDSIMENITTNLTLGI